MPKNFHLLPIYSKTSNFKLFTMCYYTLLFKLHTSDYNFINFGSFFQGLKSKAAQKVQKSQDLGIPHFLTPCTAFSSHKCGFFLLPALHFPHTNMFFFPFSFTGFISQKWIFLQGVLPLQQDSWRQVNRFFLCAELLIIRIKITENW